MTRSLAVFALYLLAVCSTCNPVTAKKQQQRRALRGKQRELATYVPTLLEGEDTVAPGDSATDAPTEDSTIGATEVPEETSAPSDKATSASVSEDEPTEAPEEETRAITPEEEKEKDPKVHTDNLGDGITFEIDSYLIIKFFKGTGFLPDGETQEVFFDMVRALYTNAIWESELGDEFLRYNAENIVADFDENNDKLTFTFTSKVDMDPKTEENPRTVAYAMGSADFKEYIQSLFAHNIAGIKHVDFKNIGTGYRL
jgi:hypothetical protein